MRIDFRSYLVLFFGVCMTGATLAEFHHPGLLHSAQNLAFIREKITAEEEPWKSAWDNLCDRRNSSLNFEPKPTVHVVRGAYGRGSIGDKDLSSSAEAAYSHALQWAITGNQAHADKVIEIINAWSPVLKDFEGNDAKLLAGWTGYKFCNAAEIIRYTNAGWSEEGIQQFERMLMTVYVPLIKDFFPEANGNWDASIINTLLCIGIFCEKEELFDRAVEHYLRGTGNGGITRYIYPSGQCEESTRDQSHTQMGLGEFADACQIAWMQGVDLYGVADNRLALGFEYTAKYMLGEDVPAYGIISDNGRGRFRDIYEGVYQHYRTFKGLDMPYTRRALEKPRSRSWGVLRLMPKASLDDANPVSQPKPISIAQQAGAQTGSSSQVPEDAVVVKVGASIQDILEAHADTGKWVVLEKGVHKKDEALRVPSGLTLSGMGLESILFLDPEKEGAAIVNREGDMHDVTFRDFVIEGGLSVKPSRDPNQDRRQRSYQMAPSRAGFLLSNTPGKQLSGLRFEHVTVRHCTHNGVAIRGAENVIVEQCNFSDNGSSVVPGPGQQHNLLLAQVTHAKVSHCRLDDSPWGSGLNAINCQHLQVSSNEFARNAAHGIRCAESNGIHLIGNLVEGNDFWGVLCDVLWKGSRDVEVVENIIRNNGEGGISVYRTGETTIKDNHLTYNGTHMQ